MQQGRQVGEGGVKKVGGDGCKFEGKLCQELQNHGSSSTIRYNI